MSTRLVFLCDIEGYSTREEQKQIECVEFLWHSAVNALKSFDLLSDCRMWGTGNGFYLVPKETTNPTKLQLCSFAETIIAACKENDIGLRVALHAESVYDVKVIKRKPTTELAGPGLNDAARMVSYADTGQIIFSEQFLKSLFESRDKDPIDLTERKIRPPKGALAQAIEVKHGFVLHVRFSSSSDSGKMKETNYVIQAILEELEELHQEFHEVLQGHKAKPRILDSRISIFRPYTDNQRSYRLRSTRYRLPSKIGAQENGNRSSRSTYWVLNDSDSQGLARAFQRQEPVYCVNLPDPVSENEKYLNRLQTDLGIPQDTSKEWQRKSRAFFWIPIFAFGVENEVPIAILCIDTIQPLVKLTNSKLSDVASSLLVSGNLRLGPLLKIDFSS